MSSTTMHFGPEWMRTKHQTPTRAQAPPSPPPSSAPSGASTYSALVSAPPAPQSERQDEAHPFRYSKEELLKIYREGGGKAGLGLEVERWEGVVREVGNDPIGFRELSDNEKKLFQGPLNSDLRRRQSTDYLSPLATQSLNNNNRMGGMNSPGGTGGSPLTNRFGGLRRRDSGADQTTGMLPRKQSFTGLQPPLQSPRDAALPSPRRGAGFQHGFDGVLGGGESWMSRRRASEASMKGGNPRDGDQSDIKASDVLEEVDEEGNPGSNNHTVDGSKTAIGIVEEKNSQQSSLASAFDNMAIGSNGHSQTTQGTMPATAAPPPPIDYASVEWSYRDPTGQVQGPFRAELMQKWFDDGYFTGDLPMKRTHLDTEFITVDELKQRHGGTKIFITPPVPPSLPPGLAPRTDSPQQQGLQQDLFNSPFQPAPLRNLRSSTLDGLGSTASNSPSSSYGGRFSNGSPDPQAFGGRAGYFNAAENGARPQPYLGVDPSNPFTRRNEPSFDTLGVRSTAFASNMANRAGSLDGFGFNRTYSPGANAWNAPVGNIGTPFDDITGAFPANYGTASVINHLGGIIPEAPFVDVSAFQPNLNYNVMSNGAGYSPASQHAIAQQIQQVAGAGLQDPQYAASQPSQPTSTASSSPAPASYQSPWTNELPPAKRPGPFDAAHPTAANTIAIQPLASSPWGPPSESSRPGSQPVDDSAWPTASQTAPPAPTSDNKPEPIVVEEVTVDIKEQKQPSPIEPAEKQAEPTPTSLPVKASTETVAAVQPASTPVPPPKISKSKSKGSQAEKKQAAAAAIQLEKAPTPTPTPATASTPKAPWSIDEDAKMKPSGSTMSLREIQEAETKKLEARKAAERERERATRAAAQAQPKDSKETVQPFTASWGLPTSQAGGKASTVGKEATASVPNTPASASTPAPAWTATPTATTTKKTMKEIQEEEEKRKKAAAKESVAAAAARRAYADTTQKSTGPAVTQTTQATQGGAWTTIGANGKPSGPPPAVRPTPTTSISASSVASATKVNGAAATPRPPVATPAVVKASPAPLKIDEPVSPSVDFLKWLSSALKGLNNSVNVEEIMSMLLSFPMDPDASTVEIISELIYANSTTLDGRRFASEFISKRKADAATRPKGASTAGKSATKAVSIAEVVKATPKPAQPEWGFKVVNKKKKGGRA